MHTRMQLCNWQWTSQCPCPLPLNGARAGRILRYAASVSQEGKLGEGKGRGVPGSSNQQVSPLQGRDLLQYCPSGESDEESGEITIITHPSLK
jgi:hypothetical protein